MKQVTLECFKDFKCIADKCKDNCCIGWEIDIDPETLCTYKSLSGPLKSRMDISVSSGDTPHFILDEKERCPFLNERNLCDIIISLGEDKLPYICKNHPRFYTWLPDRTEQGVGLCCEVAAKLLFSSSNPLNTKIPYTMSESLSDTMTYARDTAFSILQSRSLCLCDRLGIFTDYCRELDEHLIFEDIAALKDTADLYKERTTSEITQNIDFAEVLRLYSSLEPINNSWRELIDNLTLHRNQLLTYLPEFCKANEGNSYKYEHLAVYFTYRHFLNSLDDFCIAATGNFIVLGVIFCAVCDALSMLTKGVADTEENARLYSKQVEYSIENTDIIRDADIKNLKGLLPLIFGR